MTATALHSYLTDKMTIKQKTVEMTECHKNKSIKMTVM